MCGRYVGVQDVPQKSTVPYILYTVIYRLVANFHKFYGKERASKYKSKLWAGGRFLKGKGCNKSSTVLTRRDFESYERNKFLLEICDRTWH